MLSAPYKNYETHFWQILTTDWTLILQAEASHASRTFKANWMITAPLKVIKIKKIKSFKRVTNHQDLRKVLTHPIE